MDHISRVLARRRAGHPDPYKVALCIEGGGMRGVVSAGMVAALQELGGARLFDHVYGSSAGALNGAYFLAGQAEQGLPIYFEDLPERRFVCWRRYLRGGPLLHLDDLIDEVMTHVRPLDFEALHASRPTFHALAYDLAGQHVVAMPDPQDREGLFERLRASCRVPVFGGPPVVQGEHAWCDPLLHEPIPCRTPLALGATHLVVLSTRPTPAFSRAGVMQRSFEERLLTRWDPRLAASMVTDGTSPFDDATLLAELTDTGRALVISPSGPMVGRLETDPEALRAGAQRGRDAVLACDALTGGVPTVPAVAVPAARPQPSTDVVPAGAVVASPGDDADAGDDAAAARRPLPQLALDGVAWCRESTRRHGAGATALVRRFPRRRRAGDPAEGTLGLRDAAPFPALATEATGEVTGPAWRRAAGMTDEPADVTGRTGRFQTSVWSHRVRSR
ncbi:patatin family protein [Patulibacter sp.]|uniref:patatin-like phospholipase family protein n=1 Tax=Patulibacter sp. TaxID=1912859 RepID=UPI002722A9BB|nr:patatin-like phospholipase family protein [Patulibacter sp.]MDO9406827.1 patatin-like phospholipase family protein [Patulibacter sp.]